MKKGFPPVKITIDIDAQLKDGEIVLDDPEAAKKQIFAALGLKEEPKPLNAILETVQILSFFVLAGYLLHLIVSVAFASL